MTSLLRKQFVNDVVNATILATCWHEVPVPPLEGEVPNEREAEGFVRVNPSASLRSAAPLSGEPRRLRRSGRYQRLPGTFHD